MSARDDEQREAITIEVERTVESMDEALLDDRRQSVADMATRVRAALDENLVDAYSDRSGDTRSS